MRTTPCGCSAMSSMRSRRGRSKGAAPSTAMSEVSRMKKLTCWLVFLFRWYGVPGLAPSTTLWFKHVYTLRLCYLNRGVSC
jgi:hypothetical protein